MQDDPGYNRFFAYISCLPFSMLMLVYEQQLFATFFGWGTVGFWFLSIIGFWYTRSTAIFANIKAFLVNRVGDFALFSV